MNSIFCPESFGNWHISHNQFAWRQYRWRFWHRIIDFDKILQQSRSIMIRLAYYTPLNWCWYINMFIAIMIYLNVFYIQHIDQDIYSSSHFTSFHFVRFILSSCSFPTSLLLLYSLVWSGLVDMWLSLLLFR